MQSHITANSSLLLGKKMPLNFVAARKPKWTRMDREVAFAAEVASGRSEAGGPKRAVRGDDDQT